MTIYSFYALVCDASMHKHPTHEFIEAGTDQEAIHKFGQEHEMIVAELEDNGVWMECW